MKKTPTGNKRKRRTLKRKDRNKKSEGSERNYVRSKKVLRKMVVMHRYSVRRGSQCSSFA